MSCHDAFMDTVRAGTFHFPAAKAYPHIEDALVTCDQCHAHDIAACIHHGAIDLCLSCALSVTTPIASRDSLVGMRLQDAQLRCPKDKTIRVTRRGSQDYILQADCRLNRMNVWVSEDDVITKFCGHG